MSYYTERECDICGRSESSDGTGVLALELLQTKTQDYREIIDPNGIDRFDTIDLCHPCYLTQGLTTQNKEHKE